MSEKAIPETERPYHVVYEKDGKSTFHRGFEREMDARVEMARANKAAQELGIGQNYKVKEA